MCNADHDSRWRFSSHSFQIPAEHLLNSNLKRSQPPSKGTCLSLLFDVVLTTAALLAALTSTSSRRLLSQSPVSARLSEASQQAQRDPAATLHYLRRHLLVSTWPMHVQNSSTGMLLTGRAQLVLHTQFATCYTEPAVVSVPALAALPYDHMCIRCLCGVPRWPVDAPTAVEPSDRL